MLIKSYKLQYKKAKTELCDKPQFQKQDKSYFTTFLSPSSYEKRVLKPEKGRYIYTETFSLSNSTPHFGLCDGFELTQHYNFYL